MRFNVVAAIGIGILLPTLETIRRGFAHWSVNFTTMFEDYLAGAGLLLCAAGALLKAAWAPMAMLIVWSGTAFMMLLSTVSQLEREFTGTDLEPRHGIVLAFKLGLLFVCAWALRDSVRASNPRVPE